VPGECQADARRRPIALRAECRARHGSRAGARAPGGAGP
jgi:hypothetical protein